MTKNTHLATGIAVSIIALMPNDIKSLAVCICGAAIGGTISDIDVASSKPRKELNTIVGISVISIAILIALEAFFHVGIYMMLESQTEIYRVILGIVTLLLLSIYGSTTKHRTYTHSIVGVLTFSGAIWLIFPEISMPFAVAMISHIVLDLFNKKNIKILYPMKKPSVSLKLCKADGRANKAICAVSTVVVVVEILLFIINTVHH